MPGDVLEVAHPRYQSRPRLGIQSPSGLIPAPCRRNSRGVWTRIIPLNRENQDRGGGKRAWVVPIDRPFFGTMGFSARPGHGPH